MRKTDYFMYKMFLACVFPLSGLCGCAYQAKLLDSEQSKPRGGVVVQCNVVKEPII